MKDEYPAYDVCMKNSDVPRETIRRAVQLCGGIDSLGDALNVSTATLEKWLSGKERPPLEVFTQAVGLLLEATSRRPPKSGPGDPTESGRKEKPH
jgi:DNA-binding transcriptional regulator YiaG